MSKNRSWLEEKKSFDFLSLTREGHRRVSRLWCLLPVWELGAGSPRAACGAVTGCFSASPRPSWSLRASSLSAARLIKQIIDCKGKITCVFVSVIYRSFSFCPTWARLRGLFCLRGAVDVSGRRSAGSGGGCTPLFLQCLTCGRE